MKRTKARRLVRDGDLVAEIEVGLQNGDEPWGPTMSRDDAFRLDDVRDAMRRKDYQAVEKLATLYRLTPIDASDVSAA